MRHRKSALADLRTYDPISGIPEIGGWGRHMLRDAALRSAPQQEAYLVLWRTDHDKAHGHPIPPRRAPSSSTATARSIDCRCAPDAERVCDDAAKRPKERKPMCCMDPNTRIKPAIARIGGH